MDLAADLALRVVGDADAAGLGDLLKPRGDIDAVAEDIVGFDHDVAEMNADAEFNSDILRQCGVLFRHAALDFDRAARGVDGAGEFDQHFVTGRS